jgi:hypothetical protein
MKEEQDYIRDITEMRSLMERSTKFLSLSGLSGILLGLYGLAGAAIAYYLLYREAGELSYHVSDGESLSGTVVKVIAVAVLILILSLVTAVLLSQRKARKTKEKLWNATAKRLLINMAVPLAAGGLLTLILVAKGFVGLMAPLTLIFYGLALYNASKFTYEEVRSLGLIEIVLGLAGAYLPEYGLWCWALGFGILHIVYGFYLHYRYEK